MDKYIPETGTLETAALSTSRIKILLATVLALIIAALILALFILPAEFNKDPLGAGQAFGLMGLSESPPGFVETVHNETARYREDAVSFELLPFEFVEYKYELSQGATILYGWAASHPKTGVPSPVSFDFHGESHDTEGLEESYSEGKGDHDNGAFVAPFNGIHGWFWANHGADAVTVTLSTAGFYTASLMFRDGFVKKEVLRDQQGGVEISD